MGNKFLTLVLCALLLATEPMAAAGPLLVKLHELRGARQPPDQAPAGSAKVLRNRAYDSDPQQRLDVYLPANPERARGNLAETG